MKYNLSEITGLIQDRRTVFPEQYSDRKVHKEQVEKMLNNALWAPTHGHTQPWFFQAFLEEGMNKLRTVLPGFFPDDQPMKKERMSVRLNKTSAAVLVCVNYSGKVSIQDEQLAVACAVQNLMLTATAYGIGTFWATPSFIKSENFKTEFKLEANQECLGLIYMGYVEGEWPKQHRKPLEYKTTWITE